jgi:putative ABC transport system substrate-binding protein
MRLIRLVVTLSLMLAPLPALAQRQAPKVLGFLSSRSPGESASVVEAFRQGLNDAGYVEGQNVLIEFRWADGQYDRLPAMASDLVSREVALIIAAGGDRPALAAKAATSTIPIVFTGSDFPVEIGLVASLNRPGGNVTGASLFTSDLEAKKLGLLHEIVPKARLIAMLVNPTNPSADTAIADVQKAASALAQQILLLKAAPNATSRPRSRPLLGSRPADCLLPMTRTSSADANSSLYLRRDTQFLRSTNLGSLSQPVG